MSEWHGLEFSRGTIDSANLRPRAPIGVCEEHEFEWVVKSKYLTWKSKSWSQLFNLYVPKGDGPKHPNRIGTSDSRETAWERAARRRLELLNKQINNNPKKYSVNTDTSADSPSKSQISIANEKAAIAQAEVAESQKLVQQMAENESLSFGQQLKINASVARAAGLPVDTRTSPPAQTPNKHFFNAEQRKTDSTISETEFVASKPPIVKPGTDDAIIKRWTGWPSGKAMLAYMFAVCQVDVPLITERCTPLT